MQAPRRVDVAGPRPFAGQSVDGDQEAGDEEVDVAGALLLHVLRGVGRGHRVVGVHEVIRELCAQPAIYTRRHPRMTSTDSLTSPVDTATLWKGRVFVAAVTVSGTAMSVIGVPG